jgi:hypothetical protein
MKKIGLGLFIIVIFLFGYLAISFFYKTQGNSVVALFTFFAAVAAVIATWISMKNFEEELKPVVVWKGRIPEVTEDLTRSKYKASIKIINYGKGLAYVREIASEEKDIGIHIGTPITLGANTKGEITFLFNKETIDTELTRCKSDTFIRNIIFDLYYWNIKKECFKTQMDLDVRVSFHRGENYIGFECFVNNEIVEKQGRRKFREYIIHYEA